MYNKLYIIACTLLSYIRVDNMHSAVRRIINSIAANCMI